jgi:hypothetical protein
MNVPLNLVIKPTVSPQIVDLECFVSQKRYDMCVIAGKNAPQNCSKLYEALMRCKENVKNKN